MTKNFKAFVGWLSWYIIQNTYRLLIGIKFTVKPKCQLIEQFLASSRGICITMIKSLNLILLMIVPSGNQFHIVQNKQSNILSVLAHTMFSNILICKSFNCFILLSRLKIQTIFYNLFYFKVLILYFLEHIYKSPIYICFHRSNKNIILLT